jgi:hypothetical protein
VETFIPSATPGHSWQVSVIKPQGRPAFACAIHGVLKHEQNCRSFAWANSLSEFSKPDPATRVQITGPATARKKLAAVQQLQQQLRDAGLI